MGRRVDIKISLNFERYQAGHKDRQKKVSNKDITHKSRRKLQKKCNNPNHFRINIFITYY